MANGDVLDALDEKIKIALSKKRLAEKDRVQLEISQMFVIFLKSDHEDLKIIVPQVKEMWDEQETSRLAGKDNRKLWITPLITSLIALGVNLAFTAILYYLGYLPALHTIK